MIFRGAIYLVNRGANSLSFSSMKIFQIKLKIIINSQINQSLKFNQF